jgi:hypothetical protein
MERSAPWISWIPRIGRSAVVVEGNSSWYKILIDWKRYVLLTTWTRYEVSICLNRQESHTQCQKVVVGRASLRSLFHRRFLYQRYPRLERVK